MLAKGIKIWVFLALIITCVCVVFQWGADHGRRAMHNDLCDDMRVEKEAPIPCTNKYGLFYLFSYDDTYNEWQTKRNSE